MLAEVPIVVVAVPHRDASDATLYSLRTAAQSSVILRPGARLACVTVVESAAAADETALQREHLARLRRWAAGLGLPGHPVSFHVLHTGDVAHALVAFAQANHATLLILGAATHGLALQRVVPTVPVRVAMAAPCSVLMVKQALPVSALQAGAPPAARPVR